PGWTAPVPNRLAKVLGKVGTEHFRKGASSLRVGRGIGAVAYFRRIVEDHVDDLLCVLEEAALAEENVARVERIRAAKDSLHATERLKIAAENAPAILRQGNHNPLGVLYDLLSDGLHNLSDEENALVASRAQKALAFFFDTWGAIKESRQEFATDIAKQATGTAARPAATGQPQAETSSPPQAPPRAAPGC
ncbi:MAG TPA: hypothetical protein VNM89_07410, partial [Solirubrobacterales bacterium]|nr:hypothetical protein [Solirubrobacterales bacterium]